MNRSDFVSLAGDAAKEIHSANRFATATESTNAKPPRHSVAHDIFISRMPAARNYNHCTFQSINAWKVGCFVCSFRGVVCWSHSSRVRHHGRHHFKAKVTCTNLMIPLAPWTSLLKVELESSSLARPLGVSETKVHERAFEPSPFASNWHAPYSEYALE